MMKRNGLCALCAALLLFCTACGAPSVGDVGPTQTFFAMDTLMNITLMDGTEEDLSAAVLEINALDAMLSRFQPDSALAAVNASSGTGTQTPVPDDLSALVSLALSAAERTGGAYDPTVGPLMDLWGFSGETPAVPDEAALSAALALVDYRAVSVTEMPEGTGILLANPGAALDLGGIAKGYAAQKAAGALRSRGVTSALLNIGGTVSAMGTKADGSPWQIAVRDPRNEDAYLCLLPLQEQTAATSGGYERYFEENDTRYHHILDPATGFPAESGLLSATVVSADPVLADALSTALFVLGPEKSLDLWRQSGDFECILALEDGRVLVTEGLENGLEFWGAQHGYTCEIVRR